MTEKAKQVKDVLTMGMTIANLERQLSDLKIQNKTLEEENTKLQDRNQLLCALECAGVDNWGGWSDAQDMIDEWNNDEESD